MLRNRATRTKTLLLSRKFFSLLSILSTDKRRKIMSFIDSPISSCNAVREMVLTDQTQRECALEHGCPSGRSCPLEHEKTPSS
jgi:hypothetical protein